jgi:hypothetical protein
MRGVCSQITSRVMVTTDQWLVGEELRLVWQEEDRRGWLVGLVMEYTGLQDWFGETCGTEKLEYLE